MNVIAQMTPYGIYNLIYTKKMYSNKNTKKNVNKNDIGKVYQKLSLSSDLSTPSFSLYSTDQQNVFKQEILDVMYASKLLTDASNSFLNESWPKPTIEQIDKIEANISDDVLYEDYSVNILSLAQNHSFSSKALKADKKYIENNKTCSIVIENEYKQQKIAFSLSANDNIRSILHKVSDAINSSCQIAYAETYDDNGFISIKIQATSNGKKGQFSMRDDVGSTLADLAIKNVTIGENAKVIVNNHEYEIASNILTLQEDKLKINFFEVGKFDLKIIVDNQQSVNALKNLVSSYNYFKNKFDCAKNKTNQAKEIFTNFSNLFREKYSNSLLGMSLTDEDFIAFDEANCFDQLKNKPLAIMVLKDDTGVAKVFNNISNSLSHNPTNTYFSFFINSKEKQIRFNGVIVNLLV